MKNYLHDGASGLLAALILCSSPALGASTDGHRQHGSHVHGSGIVEVVVEGHDLVVALRVPAVNVVGFEHEPGTDAERAAVRQALATLGDPALMRPAAAAECRAAASKAEMVGMHVDEHDHGHEHADEKQHEEGHGHASKDDHGHGQEHAAQDEHGHADDHELAEGHAELHVSHTFHCERPQALTALDVLAFPHLLDMDELDAQVVTPSWQGAAELTPASATLRLVP